MSDFPAIDWPLAASLAATLARKGPAMSDEERARVVADLHQRSATAHDLALAVTGLPDPGEPLRVEVVGRGRWIDLTTQTAQTVLTSVAGDATATRGPRAVLARAIAVQIAGPLSWLSGQIVGQYDPYSQPHRLLAIGPNVLTIESELGVDPGDFRLWVLVHEHTHRLQFHAAPWLREHLLQLASDAVGEDHEAAIARVGATMALLEGHADVMMDRVAPESIPTVATIRAAFTKRRARRGMPALLLRLVGWDAKMRQYRDGARFCRTVIDAVGVDGFNRCFEGPENFPTPAEIADPAVWLARVCGDA